MKKIIEKKPTVKKLTTKKPTTKKVKSKTKPKRKTTARKTIKKLFSPKQFNASGAPQWLNCSASWTIKPGRNVFETHAQAISGTAIHEYAEFELTKKPPSNAAKVFYASNKNFVDGFVKSYKDRLDLDRRYQDDPGSKIIHIVEERFEYIPGGKDYKIVAKIDAALMGPKYDWIIIYDLKTGFKEVPADSEQMKVTAAVFKKLYPSLKTITATIVQPSLERVVSEDLSDIDPGFLDELDFTTDTKFYASVGEHCTYCPGNDICPKLRENLETFTSPEFAGKTYERFVEWGEILNVLGPVEKLLKTVKENANAAAKLGKPPKGWELAYKKVRRGFAPNLSTNVIAKNLGLSKDKITKTTLESPKQVEKFLKTEKQKKNFDEIITQPSAAYLKRIDK